jgi:hypothetical protein
VLCKGAKKNSKCEKILSPWPIPLGHHCLKPLRSIKAIFEAQCSLSHSSRLLLRMQSVKGIEKDAGCADIPEADERPIITTGQGLSANV